MGYGQYASPGLVENRVGFGRLNKLPHRIEIYMHTVLVMGPIDLGSDYTT